MLPLRKIPFLLLLAAAPSTWADVKLPSLFSDHMVLQADTPVAVWGWAAPGEAVSVSIGGKTQSTQADPEGKWKLTLEPLVAGKAQTLTVTGCNTIRIEDVLVGEVWVCSGQSNMEFRLPNAKNAPAEIAAAQYPEIRMFTVPTSMVPTPVEDVKAKWVVCDPSQASQFSAVGYFFARDLHQALGKPVGMIHTSLGATPAEAWTSREALAKDPELDAMASEQLAKFTRYDEDVQKFQEALNTWENQYGRDGANEGEAKGWAKPEFDDAVWPQADLPVSFWKVGIRTGGSVWFRKEFDVPASLAGKPFLLVAGFASDLKTAYFNGVKLPPAPPTKPPFFGQVFKYNVPGDLVHEGKNVVAFRVYSHLANGGIYHLPHRMGGPLTALGPDGANHWRYQIEQAGPELTAEARAALPACPESEPRRTATLLFNGMVAPLIPYSIRGFIWYQGENNATRAEQYRRLLPALISDWRERWGRADLPFYLVQLANYNILNAPDTWAELRDAQRFVASTVPHTGMAVAIDVGESDEIHPKNKQDVGHRLALLAQAKTYGQPVEDSGPVYESMRIEGSTIRLKFSHAKGLQAKGGPLQTFTIAGEDRKYLPARAVIDGDTVVVSAPEVQHPVTVRYAWANDPKGCNLYNGADLPASPFQTDDGAAKK